MALTRLQLRQQKIKAQYEAEMHRPPTRKQARAWVVPLRRGLLSLLEGEVDSVEGHPVVEIQWAGNPVARIDHSINGFISLINRANPDFDCSKMALVANKLTQDQLLTEEEVYEALTNLAQTEDEIIKHSRAQLLKWVDLERGQA